MDPDTAELYRSLQDPNSDESVRRQVYSRIQPYVGHEMDMPTPVQPQSTGNMYKDTASILLQALQGVKPGGTYSAHTVPRMAPSPFRPTDAPENMGDMLPHQSLQYKLSGRKDPIYNMPTPKDIPSGQLTPATRPMPPLIAYKPQSVANESPSAPWVGNLDPNNPPNADQLGFEVKKTDLGRAFQKEPNIFGMYGNPKSPTHSNMYEMYKDAFGKGFGENPFKAANEDPLAAWTQHGEFTPMVKQWFHRELGFGNPQQMLYERALLDQALTPQGKGISLDTVKQLQAKHNMIRMLSRKFPDEFQLPKGYKP